MLDVLNRPTGWFWSKRLVEYRVTVFGLRLCFLFVIERPIQIFGWVPIAFVRSIVGFWDWISVRFYVIVVDEIVFFIHVDITHSKSVDRVST
jgi:hypothetical protein